MDDRKYYCFSLAKMATEINNIKIAKHYIHLRLIDLYGLQPFSRLEDARQWLNGKIFGDVPHPKTGATALHVAAAKGYAKVKTL